MIIELDFEFGDYAMLKHDTTRTKRMILSVSKSIGGGIRVELAAGLETEWHFLQEIEVLKDDNTKVGFR